MTQLTVYSASVKLTCVSELRVTVLALVLPSCQLAEYNANVSLCK